MIRVWLSTARAARVRARAERGERAWRRDLHEHPDERDAFRLAQIAGLRESNAELRLQNAQLQARLAPYLTQEWMRRARRAESNRIALEPTVVVRAEQYRRPR